MFRLNL